MHQTVVITWNIYRDMRLENVHT